MNDKVSDKTLEQGGSKSGSGPFRYFQLSSLAAIVVILIVAGLGLRFIFRNLVLYEAERDATRISNALRDSEMQRFIKTNDKGEESLIIADQEREELDRRMRIFLAPFDIVKIKVFDKETRIVYSTDRKIIGRLDRENAKLITALNGSPSSKYESKDTVWDLDDEERKDVEIVETYVPIRGLDGKIIGSFEIYKDVTRDLARADGTLVRSGAVLSVTVLSVFTMLTFVIRRATHAVNSRTAELAAANKQLREQIEERKRLEEELLSITERERRWIGQELHDSIGQQLTGIEFMTKVLEEKLTDKSLEEASYAAKITTFVTRATDQTRELARSLHAVDLEANDLVSALKELTATTEHLFSSLSCSLQCDNIFPIKDTSMIINLYRIAQEAITNAIRHGKAKNIVIRLSSAGPSTTLTIENDGVDFPGLQVGSKGMGLKIMRYRAEMIGGSLDVQRGTDGGTIVRCVFGHKGSDNSSEPNYAN
ncbi:MAG: sensor histidine kinase [Planctomycetota bacterium]